MLSVPLALSLVVLVAEPGALEPERLRHAWLIDAPGVPVAGGVLAASTESLVTQSGVTRFRSVDGSIVMMLLGTAVGLQGDVMLVSALMGVTWPASSVALVISTAVGLAAVGLVAVVAGAIWFIASASHNARLRSTATRATPTARVVARASSPAEGLVLARW